LLLGVLVLMLVQVPVLVPVLMLALVAVDCVFVLLC